MKFRKLSWEQLEKDCIKLSQKIEKEKIDEIISISRGGMVMARILSDLLSLPISHISITSYQGMQQTKEPVIVDFPTKDYARKAILLVDDVSDTGKTLGKAVVHLKTLPIKKIYTASVYIKPHTTFIPDFWQENIDAWIIFPYDLKETKESFTKMYGSKQQALQKMREVGFEEWEIEAIEKD